MSYRTFSCLLSIRRNTKRLRVHDQHFSKQSIPEIAHHIMEDHYPNVDGDDYELGQKYGLYRSFLTSIRNSRIPEEVKIRRINHLKAEVFPFW